MYQKLLLLALVAAFCLTGCGDSGKSENQKNEKSDAKTADARGADGKGVDDWGMKGREQAAPSATPSGGSGSAGEDAEVGLEIDFASLMNDATFKSGMESIPDAPAYVTAMTSAKAYISLPASPEMAMNPAGYDFFAEVSFTTPEACQQAHDELLASAQGQPAEMGGKTYTKIASPGSPAVYVLQEGSTIMAYSENYVKSGKTNFASPRLRAALDGEAKSEQFKLAVDVASAKPMLASLAAMAPQAEALINSESLVIAGGTGDTMFMLSVKTGDEETAKKVRSSIQAGVAALALSAGAQLPSEEVAPATNAMYQHFMENLKPSIENNTVKIVVTKPDNYDELAKQIAEETKKIQEELQKRGLGGPGGPGGPELNPPIPPGAGGN